MFKYVMLGIAILAGTSTLSTNISWAQAVQVSNDSAIIAEGLAEAEKVARLIQFIRSMEGATFIRNGSEHSCQEAAEHLQSKWQKHKDKISSAKEFIDELASKSGMSGEAYRIRFKDGTEQTTGTMLMQELKRLEKR